MTRSQSAAIFGNEKFAEVVTALAVEGGAATAQQISKTTNIDHGMVRSVLRRAVAAGIVNELPRTGGSRGALYYQPSGDALWQSVVVVAAALLSDSAAVPTG